MECYTNCFSQEGYIDRDGVELYFIKTESKYGCNCVNNKPVIVFIHGNDMNSSIWKCQQNYFCKNYKILAIDLRGFGKSSKPPGSLTAEVHAADLKFVLDTLEITKIYLVGWSIGGIVSLSFTLSYPEYVKKLVLIDTTPQILASENFPFGRSLIEQAEILSVIEFDFPTYANDGAVNSVPERCPGAKLVQNRLRRIILSNNKNIVLRQTIDIAIFSAVDRLSTITIPTLIVFGGEDKIINPGASIFMRLNIPNSHIVEFPEAGHNPFLTYYIKFNKYLQNFFENKNKCQICK